eukprot:226059-Chlamydomonas_euryale.AAC.1
METPLPLAGPSESPLTHRRARGPSRSRTPGRPRRRTALGSRHSAETPAAPAPARSPAPLGCPCASEADLGRAIDRPGP